MSNLDSTDIALQSLLNTFTNSRTSSGDRLRGVRGDSRSRLERALNDNTAARDIQVAIRNTITTQKEIAVLQERERIEQEKLAAAAAEKQRKAINAIHAQADADLKSRVSAEEYKAVEGKAYQQLYRERYVQELIQKTPITDFTDEDQIDSINQLRVAGQFATAKRQQFLNDEQAKEYTDAIEFEEGFSNRNQSALNPIAFARNVIGGAFSAVGGVADIATTVGTGGLASPVGAAFRDLGGSIGELIDDTSFGSSINRARRSEERAEAERAGDPEGFFEGLRNDVTSQNAGSLADTVANLGSVLTGGAALNRVGNVVGRGISRAAGGGAAGAAGGTGGGLLARLASPVDRATAALGRGTAGRARDSIARGGGSALLAGAGLQQQDSLTPDDEGLIGEFLGDRFQAAGTNLAANLALAGAGGLRRTLPGTNIPVGSLVSGVEGAVAQGGLNSVRGAALRPLSAVTRPGASATANIARNAGDRVLAGGTNAIRQGLSEANQELLQTLGGSQLADTFGTNQNQFNASALGGAYGLGGLIGGGFGAGRVAAARAPEPVGGTGPIDPSATLPPPGPLVDAAGNQVSNDDRTITSAPPVASLTGQQVNAAPQQVLSQVAPNGQFGPNLTQPPPPPPPSGAGGVPVNPVSPTPSGGSGGAPTQTPFNGPNIPVTQNTPLSPQQIAQQQQNIGNQIAPNGQFGGTAQTTPVNTNVPIQTRAEATAAAVAQQQQQPQQRPPSPAELQGFQNNAIAQARPQSQVVPESQFLDDETNQSLDPNFVPESENLVSEPKSVAAQRQNQRILNEQAKRNGEPTKALPQPFNGLTGEQINAAGNTIARQAAPNGRFGNRVSNEPTPTTPTPTDSSIPQGAANALRAYTDPTKKSVSFGADVGFERVGMRLANRVLAQGSLAPITMPMSELEGIVSEVTDTSPENVASETYQAVDSIFAPFMGIDNENETYTVDPTKMARRLGAKLKPSVGGVDLGRDPENTGNQAAALEAGTAAPTAPTATPSSASQDGTGAPVVETPTVVEPPAEPVVEPTPQVPAALRNAMENGTYAKVQEQALETLAEGQLTPDQILAEYEQANPDQAYKPIRKPTAEEEVDDVPTNSDRLYDVLKKQAKSANQPEAQADAEVAAEYTEADLDRFLQEGDVKGSMRAARQLYESGAMTKDEISDAANHINVPPRITESVEAQVNRFKRRADVETRSPEEVLQSQITDAENALDAARDRFDNSAVGDADVEQINDLERRVKDLQAQQQQQSLDNAEATATPSTTGPVNTVDAEGFFEGEIIDPVTGENLGTDTDRFSTPADLPPSQTGTMNDIIFAANEPGAGGIVRRSRIDADSDFNKGTVTRALNSLEAKGLIEMDRSSADTAIRPIPTSEVESLGELEAAASRSLNADNLVESSESTTDNESIEVSNEVDAAENTGNTGDAASNTVPNRIEFNPSTDIELVDGRDLPDRVVKQGENTPPPEQQENEAAVTNKDTQQQEFDAINAPAPYLNSLIGRNSVQGLVNLLREYATQIPKLALGYLSGKTLGIYSNGSVTIDNSQQNSDTGVMQYVIAHELGHASHSLLGASLTSDPQIQQELQAVEQQLYPGLRDAIAQANSEGLNPNNGYYNYLLSGKELIAEFNALRILEPDTAARIAPNLNAQMEFAARQPNLVVKRSTHPTGFLNGHAPVRNRMTVNRGSVDGPQRLEARNRDERGGLALGRSQSSVYAEVGKDLAKGLRVPSTHTTMLGSVVSAFDPEATADTIAETYVSLARSNGMELNDKELSQVQRAAERVVRLREQTNARRNDSRPQVLARRTAKRAVAITNNAVDATENAKSPEPMAKGKIKSYAQGKASSFTIEVINDPATELDEDVNAQILEDTGYEWDDTVDAAISGTTIYLNGNNMFSETDIDLALIHEILGHAGLREVHGPKLNGFLQSVLDSYGGLEGLLEAADRAGLSTRADYANLITRAQTQQGIGYNQDHLTIAEEVLVGIVEADEVTQAEKGLIAQIGEAIRNWIRRAFPNVGRRLGDDVIADWELLQYAREASKAGRKLLDGAQAEGTPRIYMARSKERAIDRVNRLAQSAKDSDVVDYAKNIIGGDAPLGTKLAGTNESIKERGRRAKLAGRLGTKENLYNKFFREIINNRRPMQLTTQVMRADWHGAAATVLGGIVEGLDTLINTNKNIKFRKDREATERAILGNFFGNFFGPNATLESKLEIMKDKVALYEKIQLAQAQAEYDHFKATQVLDGDFRTGVSLLAQADGRKFTTQREAYDFADAHRRIVHGFERNESFFYDYTHNDGNLKKWLSKQTFAELEAVRALTNATDGTAVEPEVAFQREKAIIDREIAKLDAATQAEIKEVRLNDIKTTGPNTSTLELKKQLAELNITAQEQKALDVIHNVLDQYIEMANTKRSEWQGTNKDFNDQIKRYGWKFYAPQWSAAKNDSEFMAGSRHYDSLTSTFDKARGQENETTSPIASIIQMVADQYHDQVDNDITRDVIGLWAMAQSNNGARILGKQWGEGSLELVKKGTKRYRKLMKKNNPDLFIHHLNEQSAGLINAGSRGEFNTALNESPDNFVMVLKYKKKKNATKTNSYIPDLVKGRKRRSATVQKMRDSENPGIQVLNNGARGMGLQNTKYNPKHYLVNLSRETVTAFSTVGAKLGVKDGINEFSTESMAAALQIAPKMAQFLYYSGLPGAEAAASLAALENAPEMADFMEFWNSGAPTHLSRALTLNGRMDDLVNNLRARGLTPDANLKVQEADRLIAVLPMMTDMIGRFAAYKTFRKNDFSIQQSAHETRNIADFAQQGESELADWGTTLFMFFRSGMVGLGQIVDLSLDSKYNTEAAGVAAAASTILFGLGYTMSGEDEEGNNLFLTQGESPTHFKLFLGDKGVQIPWSYNPFTAVAAMTQQGLFAATGNQSYVDASTNMVDIIMNNLTPIGNNIPLTDGAGNFSTTKALQKFGLLATPSLATPLGMIAMNVNNFGGQITSPEGIGSAGRFGRVFDTPGGEIGGLAEDFTRGVFAGTNFPLDVRRWAFGFSQYMNGPTFTYNSAKEWFRIATGGADYESNTKLAAFVAAGFVASPNSSVKDQYYETKNQLQDITASTNALKRAGFSEREAEAYVRATVGDRVMANIARFDDLNSVVDDLSSDMKDIRVSNIMTDTDRLIEYNRLKKQHTREISRVVRALG